MGILFKHAGILAWRDGDFHYIPNGFLGVENESIVWLSEKAPKEKFDREEDMSGRLLMPGLINSHCHAATTVMRGVGSDLPLEQWLFDTVFPIEDRMTAEDVRAGNALAMMEMIATGTTAFSDMYFEAGTAAELNETVGMKINTVRAVLCEHPDDIGETSPRITQSEDLYNTYHNIQNGRFKIDFCVHGEYTCNDSLAQTIADRALIHHETGIGFQIHLSETEKEHLECIERHGCTPVEWCERMGIFKTPTAAAHCIWVTPEDIAIMKRCNVSPVHCPTSNMKLGSGFAPIPEMLAAGLNVGLGTDGAASNNNLNLFEEMHMAAVLHNGYRHDPTLMPPKTVLKMATVNGAKIQGRTDTGCLEVGKKADIIAVDFRNKGHLYPAFDPMAMLVYAAQGSDVCMTMVDGKMLYWQGAFLTLDADQVLSDARKAIKRLYGEQ